MPLILIASLLLASVVAADESQTIYRSTDDSGAVSFSDRAPEDDRPVQVMQLEVPQAGSAEEHRERMQQLSASADRMAEERRARERHRAEMRELAARSQVQDQAAQPVAYEQSPSYVLAPRYHRPWRPPHVRPPHRPRPVPPVAGNTDLRANNAYNSQLMRPVLSGNRR